MVPNYFKIAWRNLPVKKLVSSINIFGLGMVTGCCILICLYEKNEPCSNPSLSIHNIYKPVKEVKSTAKKPSTMGPLVKGNFPGVLKMVRIGLPIEKMLGYKDKKKPGNTITLPDSGFFTAPSLPAIHEPKAATDNPGKIVPAGNIALDITFFNVAACLRAVKIAIANPVNLITKQDV